MDCRTALGSSRSWVPPVLFCFAFCTYRICALLLVLYESVSSAPNLPPAIDLCPSCTSLMSMPLSVVLTMLGRRVGSSFLHLSDTWLAVDSRLSLRYLGLSRGEPTRLEAVGASVCCVFNTDTVLHHTVCAVLLLRFFEQSSRGLRYEGFWTRSQRRVQDRRSIVL